MRLQKPVPTRKVDNSQPALSNSITGLELSIKGWHCRWSWV